MQDLKKPVGSQHQGEIYRQIINQKEEKKKYIDEKNKMIGQIDKLVREVANLETAKDPKEQSAQDLQD